jgi:hypothetical protein
MEEKQSIKKFVGRIVSGAYYDMQQVRIATKNRIRDVIRKKIEGISFDEVEEKKEDKDFEQKYKDAELLKLWDKLESDQIISEEEHDYVLKCWEIADESEKIEAKYKQAMLDYIMNERVYTEFLQHVRGIGEVLSANLIKEFGDCSRYDTVSKLWAHTGNSVVGGLAPKKRKGEDLHFSPRLRTLTWKISDCLLKNNKGLYRQVYNSAKERALSATYGSGELLERFGKPYKAESLNLSRGHAHAQALRKMRKLFLSHFWACAREMAGLSSRSPFADKLGHKNIISWREALKYEKPMKL